VSLATVGLSELTPSTSGLTVCKHRCSVSVTEQELPSFIQSPAHVKIAFAFRRFAPDNFHAGALSQAVQSGFRKRGQSFRTRFRELFRGILFLHSPPTSKTLQHVFLCFCYLPRSQRKVYKNAPISSLYQPKTFSRHFISGILPCEYSSNFC
jgi:hypothetical protein